MLWRVHWSKNKAAIFGKTNFNIKQLNLGLVGILGLFFLSIISSYNSKLDQGIMTNSEELFIILILPGLDMFRIFIERLINKQNPFSGDKQHLHHYLIKKYSLKISLFAYLIMLSTPYICYQVTNYKPILIITASIISYFIIIFHLRKFNLKWF